MAAAMLIDGIEGLSQERVPVVVVGSGPVGLTTAVELARKGIDVVLLESGGRTASPEVQALSDAHILSPDRHDDMRIAIARRLGGTSHLWGGRCIPYDPIDFADREWVDARWPISYADMAAYLPRAIAATRSGAPVFEADEQLLPEADSDFIIDRIERWVNVQSSDAVFRTEIATHPHLKVRTHATLVGMEFTEAGSVGAILIADSRDGRRVKMPVTRLVIAAGGLETARLLLVAARDGNGRFGGADGPLGRYYMGHLYSEIADIVFNGPDMARAMDFHVDRYGSYVRRRFVASDAAQRRHRLLNASFWPVVPEIFDPRHKSAALSLVYLAIRDPRIGRFFVAEAISKRHRSVAPQPVMAHLANLITGAPEALRFAATFLYRRYGTKSRLPGFFLTNRAQRYGLSYHGEQSPNRDSRVWLGTRQDRLGMPELSIDLRYSVQDAHSLVVTHDLLDEWLVRNGVGRLDYRVAREEREAAILAQAAHGTHQIGLARMGGNRREGVVDRDLRVFDAPNLFLASCAVLPTSGQANPTLTAIALAIRLADQLAGNI